jgi:hypothetical protein
LIFDYGSVDLLASFTHMASGNPEIAYAVWFAKKNHPSNTSRRQCWARTEKAKKVCASIGGTVLLHN